MSLDTSATLRRETVPSVSRFPGDTRSPHDPGCPPPPPQGKLIVNDVPLDRMSIANYCCRVWETTLVVAASMLDVVKYVAIITKNTLRQTIIYFLALVCA